MLLTRKEKRDITSTEAYVRQWINDAIRGIVAGDLTFLDEIYRTIDARVRHLQEFGTINLEFIDAKTPVDSSFYVRLARQIKELSDLNLITIPEIYQMLQEVADDVYSAGESITESINTCQMILSKVEGNMKRKMALSSVKDEFLVYDSILSDEHIGESNLGIDYRGGFVTLAPDSYDRIWFEISEVKFNKNKGKIARPKDSNNSLDFFTDGYFNARTFSSNPSFENIRDVETTHINDGRLLTTYTAEYNTLDPTEPFIMSLTLNIESKAAAQFGPRRIDQVLIYLDPGERTSVITTEMITPYLSRLSINGEEKSTEILDNAIQIRGATVGEHERGFQTKMPAVYPTGSYMVCMPNVTQVLIELVADRPQEVWYPEKVVRNDTGNVLHKFNYMETLILNSYEPTEGHPDPSDLYTEREINDMIAIMGSGHDSYDQHVILYRFAIGLKDIELFAYNYKTNGYFITRNLNAEHQDRNIAAAEVYVSEIVPDGTSIQYYVSYDKVIWHEVSPVNRANTNGLPTRIVYNGIDLKDSDEHISIDSPNVFIKVVMNGARDLTPRLKSYAVRVKLQ